MRHPDFVTVHYMKALILSIGEELLTGQTVNTNAAWMARQLNLAAVEVEEIRVIHDKRDDIRRSLQEVDPAISLVLITGGLGPTRDDVTRDVLCEHFDARLVPDQEVLNDITTYFTQRGREVTGINRDQAMVPNKARVLRNPNGTAPGMWFELDGRSCIAMPGVPFEMKEMMRNLVMPALLEKQGDRHILHKTVLTQGVGESALMEIIEGWEDNLPEDIQLAYLPSTGIVKLRLTGRGSHKSQLEEVINGQIDRLKQIIPEYIWGYDDDTLEGVLGEKLRERGLTLTTAESCTGGYLAHRITSVAGSSDYFTGGIIAYDNRVKTGPLLGVDTRLIDSHGAVSREVAEAMALGAREGMHTDLAVATTGIAGPGGGTTNKPVGTTWIAIASEKGVHSKHYAFGNNRGRNLILAANAAMAMLIHSLK